MPRLLLMKKTQKQNKKRDSAEALPAVQNQSLRIQRQHKKRKNKKDVQERRKREGKAEKEKKEGGK